MKINGDSNKASKDLDGGVVLKEGDFKAPSEVQEVYFDEIVRAAELQRSKGRQVVAVQGLGFVGTAVAAAIAAATDALGRPLYFVIGVDLPSPAGRGKVAQINSGFTSIVSPDRHLPELIKKAVCETNNLCATVSEQAYSLADIILVDVPFSLSNQSGCNATDIDVSLEAFEQAISAIGRSMRPEALVLVETTVPVGTCEQVVVPILREERSRRGVSGPLCLAHAYERVMPGPFYIDSVRRCWRTYAGVDEASAERAGKFLSSFIDIDSYPLWQLDDINASELGKLLENSYRAVNIAFIYEWTLMAEQIGIDLFSVIESIRVRKGTHDNIRLPGFGVGGYCLTKDSLLAQWSLNHLFKSDVVLGMTLEALRINRQMPLHSFDLLAELFGGHLAGRTIAVCGATYLPDVADTRNSPTELLVDELVKIGCDILVHDPCVKAWPERDHIIRVSQDLTETIRGAEGIVFAVSHRAYRDLDPKILLDSPGRPPCIVDAQNILSDEKANLLHSLGCRLLGVGKGHWRKKGYHWPV